MNSRLLNILLLIITVASGCQMEEKHPAENEYAEVLSVQITGGPSNYTFAVEIKSPDTGCDQYADWWEVVSEDTELLYRRILTHSHVNEQPFRRSGGPVKIESGQRVIIRMHMNNLGYSTRGLLGTVATGFTREILKENFGTDLLSQQPLPGDCPN